MKLPAFISNLLGRRADTTSAGSAVASADASPSLLQDGLSGRIYDGAVQSPIRTSFLGFPLNARNEITRYNRVEILRKVRALEANLGLISRMKGQVRKYAVGRGIFPVPQTKDIAWNEEAMRKFDFWANNRFVSDVAGAMTFWERQGFHAQTFFAEGESFDALVSSSFSGAPQLQLFDNSEVGGFAYERDMEGYVDGVKANDQNRPLSYLVRTLAPAAFPYSSGQTLPIDAGNMIHLIRRKRVNQLRAISPFAPGINCAIDKLDIRALTTQAAKLHEALGIVVNKRSGEAGKKGITGQVNKLVGTDGKVTEVNENFIRGANIQYLQLDEKIEMVKSDRPTQNLMAFGDELVRDICLGTELNYEIVWTMMELGGATARVALADAQWFFDGIQDALNELFNQRVWVWWCASMMNMGQLARCTDPDWWVCHWQGPPKLTADHGRAAQAEIDLLHSGLNNWQDYYNQRGRNWKEPLQQRIDELKWAKAQCELAGISMDYIFSLNPGTPINIGYNQSDVAGG